MKSIGEFIKKKRVEGGLSLRDFASLCGLSHSYIDSLEKGFDPRTGKPLSPTMDTLEKITKGLSMSLDEFLKLTGFIGNQSNKDITIAANKLINPAILNYVQIGDKIKKAREELVLSQAELAKKVGPSEIDIKYFEMGEREISLETLNKIGQVVNKPLSYFIPDSVIKIHEPESTYIIPTKPIPLFGKIETSDHGFATQEKLGEIHVSNCLDADFCLIANGDSMIGAGISPGDIAICRKTQFADHGDIVAALVNGRDTTLKYLLKEGDIWLLRAANPKYPDLILRPEDDRIQGIVVKVERVPVDCKETLITKKQEGWADVAKEAAKHGISPEVAKRLIKSFGRLKDGLPEEDED